MNGRMLLALVHDLAATAVTWIAAFWIRYNLQISEDAVTVAWQSILLVMSIYFGIFFFSGMYRSMWRYASMSDLKRMLLGVVIGGTATAALVHLGQISGIPRSVLVAHPLLLILVMGGDRFAYRAYQEWRLSSGTKTEGSVALIIGAGSAAAGLVKELSTRAEWQIAGLLDDDPSKQGRRLNNIPVLGPIDRIAEYSERLAATHAIIALPSSSSAMRRRATELAVSAGLNVLTVPAYGDLLTGKYSISNVRKVELEDILGRDQIQLDNAGLNDLLTNKVVLVTGAGGSIGSELCRQIANFSPQRLVFYELSEFALYAVEQEFSAKFPSVPISCAVGDVKDRTRLDATFSQYRPDIVFHAAAYKHVPLMERENAWEAVRNNVLGTACVARTAVAHSVREFVLISTDKAVNPTNVMGASKRLAELTCQAIQRTAAETRFVTVRFGNVLGSSGSVIPKFREQIAKGGPISVTHPEIVRYFMLIPEAAQLVLQAALMGNGGEIFVLNMGEPVKIIDLARDMIRLSGLDENDIKVEITGLRPGEKLYEELLADTETTLPTRHPKLRIARANGVHDDKWLAELDSWLAFPRSEAETKDGLRARIPEYRPTTH